MVKQKPTLSIDKEIITQAEKQLKRSKIRNRKEQKFMYSLTLR